MQKKTNHTSLKRIAFIGSYLPRQCGIATFTTDLCENIAEAYPHTSCIVLPVNDLDTGYEYPSRVRFELYEKDIASYRTAADFLNINNVDLVCLQHEYGIYGGRAGSHILTLLRELRIPVVTTLHTILHDPDPEQHRVLQEVTSLSDRIVVMSQRGQNFLQDVYHVPAERIDVIPHGIPDVPFVDPSFYKDIFGVEGKTVLLTFGLLSANKGIENVIEALPAILERYPQVVYFVLGVTHPHVLRDEGETYRLFLQRLAREKGVAGNVAFFNRFVELDELKQFIGAADIYITPYNNPEQSVSGTLAYTVGAGKAVVSTPYWYAEEVLDDGRGALIPFRDPQAMADRIIDLLDHEAERNALRKQAYLYGRNMTWSQVAVTYMHTFERARRERRRIRNTEFGARALEKRLGEWPPIKLDHLFNMTDQTGILQHALFTIPNYDEGYTTDDNARALIVSMYLEELGNPYGARLANRYLAFLGYAYDSETHRFRNFMDYQRHWLNETGSDDSHGRSLWALGVVLRHSTTPALHQLSSRLFQQSLLAILPTTSPRAWAFALLGIHEYLQKYAGDRRANQVQEELSERLLSLYDKNKQDDWCWFEDRLTYCNAALSHALLLSDQSNQSTPRITAGLDSLRWLVGVQRSNSDRGHFVPIGSNGFYQRGGVRSRFDQQPVETQATVSACLEALRLTGDPFWGTEARRAFEWYLGRNDLNMPVYDPTTGGCRDGLHQDRPNENQGAESTLAFLQSLLELQLAEYEMNTNKADNNEETIHTTAPATQVQSNP